ncbi:MAG: CatA-like O-acetyltransferase [Clostridia bacterium]|nr:CatA-like O-acetyltransferase [Clostridia bacterium]
MENENTKEINLEDFERKDSFLHFFYKKRPFVSITTELEITNLVKYSKKNKNLYALIGYVISKTVNQINEFKYRFENGKIVLYDKIISSFVDLKPDNNIGFVPVEYSEKFTAFVYDFKASREKMLTNQALINNNSQGQIWFSCVPWYKFSSVEVPYDDDYTIPQFIWGQYELKKRKYFINMHIFANHAFVDGFHIGKFINIFNEIQKNIKEYI